ncbi:MAG: hypothetical protein PF518_08655 [Spirochaetaceae bacterium]|nr:hypothetical protein [Spirochaetaceae bacterium]
MNGLKSLAEKLPNYSDKIKGSRIVTGFDGFLDQMISVVDQRKDLNNYDPVQSMKQFGDLIKAASNRSSLREIVIESTEIGGCAVNLGDGIVSLGSSLDFYGSMGKPMNKAFKDFATRCNLCVPLACDPGLTMAFEFHDGKYMLSSVNQLAQFNRTMLIDEFKDGRYLQSCKASDLIAFTDWTLYPHMTDCWLYIQDEVLSKLNHRPYIFIDLVDPRSRSEKDICEMIEVLKKFEKYGKTIFGGNLNEGNVLAELYHLDSVEKEGPEVAKLAEQIRETLGISMVALHCTKGAAYADESGNYWADGPYCSTPRKSTGAGDRFNGGFCLGTILDLEPEERLILGGATSGFFVRYGYSGSMEQIIELMKAWDNNTLDKK